MAKATARTAAKPAAKTNQLPPRTSTPTKAQLAARAQGRAEPEDTRNDARPKTAIATRTNRTEVADPSTTNLPAFMHGDMGAGKTDIGSEDLEQPRLKLMQGLSKELEAYNDLRPGNFFHTSSEEIFAEPFVGVPLFYEKRYILWRPQDDGGGILARADDGVHWSPSEGEFEVKLNKADGGAKVVWKLASTVAQSGLANWGTQNPEDSNSPPAATLMYNYLLAFPDHPDLMPAVFTFQRSGIKQGKRFNTRLKTTRGPIYGSKFMFTPIQETNSRGQDFWNVQVSGAGLIEDETLYRQYKDIHESFKGTGLKIRDIESLGEDDVGTNEAEGEQTGHNKY